MRRARYQYGNVELSPRSLGPAVWVYRWREIDPQGNSARKSIVLGSSLEIDTKTAALKAAERFRMRANSRERELDATSFGELIERFVEDERLEEIISAALQANNREADEKFNPESLDPSTAHAYLSMLKVHIRPRWGDMTLSAVKPVRVQEWLRGARSGSQD